MERDPFLMSEKYPVVFNRISENLKFLNGGMVSLDIDAVTQKTYALALNNASHFLGKNISVEEVNKYWGLIDIAVKNGINKEDAQIFARTAWNNHQVYSYSPIMEGSLNLLRIFNEACVPYMFISSRPTEFKADTKRWFENNLPWVDPNSIIVERFGSADGGAYKADIINKYGIVLHIEDALEEAKTIVEETGSKVIVVPQPWNDHDQFIHPNIKYLGKFDYSEGTYPVIKFLASDSAKDFLDHVAHY